MFNGLFQPTHLILILVVVLIVYGPGKLPEVGKAMGKTLKDMRNAFASSDEEEKKSAAATASAAAGEGTASAAAKGNVVN